MFIVRAILGALILFFNWVFTPKSIKRDATEPAEIDELNILQASLLAMMRAVQGLAIKYTGAPKFVFLNENANEESVV